MMRNGQNKRMRGRNNRKSHNPLARLYESNGPDVKVRGTASHVAEKYLQLARDAQSSGDPVSAENYFQHAEHYLRLIAAAQEQFRQSQPFSRGEGEGRDDSYDDSEMESATPAAVQAESSQSFQQPYPPREPQSREQPFGLREPQPYSGRQPSPAASEESGGLERLPAFITGGGQPQPQGPNGFDGQPDRFSHRRRRRHRPRGEGPASPGGEAADEAGPAGE